MGLRKSFTYFIGAAFVFSLLFSIPASAQYRSSEVKRSSGWFSNWRWPWESRHQPVNNSVLMNPGYDHPPINGPRMNINPAQFHGLSSALTQYANQPRNTRPQPPQQQLSVVQRAYDTVSDGLNFGVNSITNGFLQIPGVAYIRDLANWAYNWTTESWNNLIGKSRNAVHSRRGAGCQAIAGSYRSETGSLGCCKASVNDFLVSSGILKQRIPGLHAKESAPYLRNLKNRYGQPLFKEVTADAGRDPRKAPLGSIVVYDNTKPITNDDRRRGRTARSGHIEVRTGLTEWTSDMYADSPICEKIVHRPVLGIFVRTKAEEI